MSPVEGGVTNWPPPAYSPDTGLFYVHERNGFNILYLTETDPRGSMGLGGQGGRAGVGALAERAAGDRLQDREGRAGGTSSPA